MAGHHVSVAQTASGRSQRSAITIVDWRSFGDTRMYRISRSDGQTAESTGGSVASDKNGREERLAQALRANLHRRKAQSRARRQGDGAAPADKHVKNNEILGMAANKVTVKGHPAVGSPGGRREDG